MGGANPTVLIVEDEVSLLDLYAQWLDDYEVRRATSEGEASDRLDDSVDVVLLDRILPGSSGAEILEMIRERSINCRVAMVTAVEPDFDIIEMGFDDYIRKPVSGDTLSTTVERLLARDEVAGMARELFALVSKRSVLQSTKPSSELESSEEYAALEAEIERIGAEIDDSLDSLDSSEMVSMIREIEADSNEEGSP